MKERVKWRAVKNRKQQRSMNGEKEGIRGGSKEHGKTKEEKAKSETRRKSNQTGEWEIRDKREKSNRGMENQGQNEDEKPKGSHGEPVVAAKQSAEEPSLWPGM